MKQPILHDVEITLKSLQDNIFRVKKNNQGDIVYMFNEGPIPRKLNVCTNVVYGKSIIDLVGEESAASILPYYEDAFRGKVISYEFTMGEIIFQTVLSPVEIDGEIKEVSGTSYDITEKVRREKELKDAHEELKKLNEANNKLFSVIAHDLRSPMGSVASLLDYTVSYLEDGAYDEVYQLITECKEAALNSYNLVENLFDWAKNQLSDVDIFPQTFPINSIIEECIRVYRFVADSKQVNLHFDSPQRMDVFADKNMIRSVIRNLMGNAIKYSNEKSEVRIILSQDSDYCIISIKDQGTGISRERQEKLFTYQSDKSTYGTHGEKGAGLGLVLSYDFVNRNKGEINVKSEPGIGSTFTLKLPVSYSKRTASVVSELRLDELCNKSILVVEDEDVNFLYIQEILKHFRFKVLRAKNGEEAILQWKKHTPDLIIMDYGMPILDGLEAVKKIRESDNKTPVIFHTSYNRKKEIDEALSVGCNGFIKKPLSLDGISELISRYLYVAEY